MLAMCINPLQLGRCDFCLSAFPTASHRSSLTRHFVVGISRMEVIAHVRTSSNDHRSHRYDTGISSEYVIDFYCPFGPPPLILSLACDTILIISQEALFCYPHRFRLLHSPQHSWGIRLFIYYINFSFLLLFTIANLHSIFRHKLLKIRDVSNSLIFRCHSLKSRISISIVNGEP